MAKEKIDIEAVADLTKELFHHYYAGNPEPWFSHLCSESVYLGNGDQILFGGDVIRKHFQKFNGIKQADIVRDEYYSIKLSDFCAQVYGQIVVKGTNAPYGAITEFTMIYRFKNGELKLIHQHNSYEYTQFSNTGKTETIEMDMTTLRFVQQLVLDQPLNKRLAIHSGRQTVLVNPYMILYVQSKGKRTELICVDRIVDCNSSISEMKEKVPDFFFSIHRSYLVNTRYITAIRRFEVELISGITLPIPAVSYMQIKKDLNEMLQKSSRS